MNGKQSLKKGGISEKSVLTTLCYMEQEGKYLMMHRMKRPMISMKENGLESGDILKRGKARRSAFCGR